MKGYKPNSEEYDNRTYQQFHRVKPCHIASEWSEGHPDQGGDGYWISLKPGWRNAIDMCEPLHTIHEDTKTKAYAEYVAPCDCRDCLTTINHTVTNQFQ